MKPLLPTECCRPPGQPKAVVQFNGGTGTNRALYRSFLTYLAEYGYLCCSWDYRGSGHSAPGTARACAFTYADYGT